ncbi:NAD(P)-binding domain [Phytophthora cactorum]|nr:NAD(P)-binding domain [Phytophthora cactorum]
MPVDPAEFPNTEDFSNLPLEFWKGVERETNENYELKFAERKESKFCGQTRSNPLPLEPIVEHSHGDSSPRDPVVHWSTPGVRGGISQADLAGGLSWFGRGISQGIAATHKLPYAHDVPECSNLVETLDRIKPTALIGVCTIAKAFNEEVCQKMNELNEHPIIFALSNSASKAECTAEEAYTFTNGQGNNSYIFPGVGLGVVAAGLTHVNNEIMIIAAKTLAGLTTPADLETGCVYPPLSSIQEVSLKIAEAVAEYVRLFSMILQLILRFH